MNQGCYADSKVLIPENQAIQRLCDAARRIEEQEHVALSNAGSRVLAAAQIAPIDAPFHDNSAKDGERSAHGISLPPASPGWR